MPNPIIQKFLTLILPPQTVYCISVLRGKSCYNKPFTDLASAAAYAIYRDADPTAQVYFACSGYRNFNDFHRSQANVAAVKAFWLDLDCGGGKEYATKVEALADLKKLLAAAALPAPLIVDSGHGLHCYWLLTEAVTPQQWNIMAARLDAVCRTVGLRADSHRTRDSASILRIPGTFNKKNGEHLEVKLLSAKTRFLTPVQFAQALLRVQVTVPTAMPAAVPPVPSAPAGVAEAFSSAFTAPPDNLPRDWKQMVIKCRQIREMGGGSYPEWMLAARTVLHTTGGAELVHALSKRAPDKYSPADCDRLIKSLQSRADVGPGTCDRFAACAPDKCAGCPYRGKIKTPWSLCEIAAPKEITLPAPDLKTLGTTDPGVSAISQTETVTVKPFDDGHFKVVPGVGICVTELDENDVPHNRCILPIELYIHGLVIDNTVQPASRTYLMRKIVKDRAPEEIPFSIEDAYGPQKTEKWLAQVGCAPHPANRKLVITMISAYLAAIQNSLPPIYVRTHFGWVKQTDPRTGAAFDGFIVGDRMYTADDVKSVRLDERASGLAPRLSQQGTLEEWKQVPKLYGDLNQKIGQLLMCASFGAPLMHLGVGTASNIVFNLFEQQGGKGKTSLMKACASVWGNPLELMMSKYDTAASRYQMLSTYKNLPCFIDEITGIEDMQAAATLYDLTSGREKSRSTQSGTGLTKVGHWDTVTILSANQSLYESLRNYKSQTTATMMRLIELRCDFKDYSNRPEQSQINSALQAAHHNYGLAGPLFIQYILKHRELLAMVGNKAREFAEKYSKSSDERFWVYGLAIPLYAGIIAKALGLIDYDLEALRDYCINKVLPGLRALVKHEKPTASNTITDFLNDSLQDTLTVRAVNRESFVPSEAQYVGTSAFSTSDPYVVAMPVRQLTIRHELDTNTYYVSLSALVRWCQAHNLSLDELCRSWRQGDVSARMRMTRCVLARGVDTLPQSTQQVYRFTLPKEDT